MKRDIVARGPDGSIKLIVEARHKTGTDSNWARQLHRNYVAHGFVDPEVRFMLALPDKIYLWDAKASADPEASPRYSVDAGQALDPYLRSLAADSHAVEGQAFELLVLSWLNDAIGAARSQQTPPNIPGWMVESGLLRELKDARLEQETDE